MGVAPRWRKVLRDFAGNKLRSGLAILSIAVGIFAAGAVAGSRDAMVRALAEGYAGINAPSATIFLDAAGDAAIRDAARDIAEAAPGVALAEWRHDASARVQLRDGSWRELRLRVVEDFER